MIAICLPKLKLELKYSKKASHRRKQDFSGKMHHVTLVLGLERVRVMVRCMGREISCDTGGMFQQFV